jgi:hypothetical protein
MDLETRLDLIMAMVDRWWADAPHMHHWMANPLIEVDLDAGTATGATALDCLSTFTETGPTHVGGRYIDEFVRLGDGWAIDRRIFDVQFVTPMADWKPVAGTEAEAPPVA